MQRHLANELKNMLVYCAATEIFHTSLQKNSNLTKTRALGFQEPSS